jgi:hypothetical protein
MRKGAGCTLTAVRLGRVDAACPLDRLLDGDADRRPVTVASSTLGSPGEVGAAREERTA